MGKLDRSSRSLLEGYLFSKHLKTYDEGDAIENINDPVRLIARLERTSEKFQQKGIEKFMTIVGLMFNVSELIYLWKQLRGKQFNQANFREIVEERTDRILEVKRNEGINIREVLRYLKETPICTCPQRIILRHLKIMIRGNARLIEEVIKGELELPYNLKDFFTQEVRKLVSE